MVHLRFNQIADSSILLSDSLINNLFDLLIQNLSQMSVCQQLGLKHLSFQSNFGNLSTTVVSLNLTHAHQCYYILRNSYRGHDVWTTTFRDELPSKEKSD